MNLPWLVFNYPITKLLNYQIYPMITDALCKIANHRVSLSREESRAVMGELLAGKATDAQRDLSVRGGRVMIRRRTRPLATWDSLYVTASRCQFGLNGIPGRTTPKANSVNAIRSWASSACRTTSGLGSALTAAVIVSLFIGFIWRVVTHQLGGREDRGGRGGDRPVGLPRNISVEDALAIPSESFIECFLWCQKLGP